MKINEVLLDATLTFPICACLNIMHSENNPIYRVQTLFVTFAYNSLEIINIHQILSWQIKSFNFEVKSDLVNIILGIKLGILSIRLGILSIKLLISTLFVYMK